MDTLNQRWTPLQIGYIAGLVDGEGCIAKSHGRPLLTVTVTDKDIIERLVAYSGLGTVLGPYKYRSNEKQLWRWNVGKRDDLLMILQAIRPHMCARRVAKIDEALDILNGSIVTESKCRHCSVIFEPDRFKDGRQKYCSPACGRHYRYKKALNGT